MNIKKFAIGAAVFALIACNEQAAAPKKVAIDANSTSDEKTAYMLGVQFGIQNFSVVPRQMGEELNIDALVQGILDNIKSEKDTNFKLQMSTEQLQEIGTRYTEIARKRISETRPDSAKREELGNDYAKINAYMDSVSKAQKVTPAAPSNGSPLVINEQTSDNQKFSYLIGLQFGSQFNALNKQIEGNMDEQFFILGVKESEKKHLDSNFVMQLPEDSLKAISSAFSDKIKEVRMAAAKKQQEEMEKVKAAVAELRGDTLSNGMPKLMNFKVSVTGISVKATDISEFADKPLLVFYFSATCGHCQHAAPQILEIAKEFAASGLTTLAVASGGNNKTGIRKFMDNANWDETINVVWDESRQFGELYSDGYVPKVYLVNKDASYKLYGSFESEKDALKSEIDALLKGTPVVWNIEAPKTEEAAK